MYQVQRTKRDTKKIRTQFEDAKNNPDNVLNHMSSQAKEHYLSLKDDVTASLLKEFYTFPKSHDNTTDSNQ